MKSCLVHCAAAVSWLTPCYCSQTGAFSKSSEGTGGWRGNRHMHLRFILVVNKPEDNQDKVN